jgi:DNA-binding NarL/FixJ family response regulator
MSSHWGLVVARPGLVRDALQAVLSAVPEVHALKPADDGASSLARLNDHRPDLVILDSSLSEDELCATLSQMKAGWPDVCCIVIVANPRHRFAVEAAGADAVLVEGFPAPLLPTTIKALLAHSSPRALSERGEPGLGQPPGEGPGEIPREEGGDAGSDKSV